MLFYFHAGDAPLWILILILLFIMFVPTAVCVLAFFVIYDFLKWRKGVLSKENKDKKS